MAHARKGLCWAKELSRHSPSLPPSLAGSVLNQWMCGVALAASSVPFSAQAGPACSSALYSSVAREEGETEGESCAVSPSTSG